MNIKAKTNSKLQLVLLLISLSLSLDQVQWKFAEMNANITISNRSKRNWFTLNLIQGPGVVFVDSWNRSSSVGLWRILGPLQLNLQIFEFDICSIDNMLIYSVHMHLIFAILIVHWYIHPNLQALHPNLESVHGLDGRLGAGGVVEADEAEALALVGRPVDEHLRADHVAKGEEHLHELGVAKLLGQVVDEEVAALGAADRAAWKEL